MPIQELLALAESEYEALQSKYNDALVENSFLRTHLALSKPLDFPIDSLGGDFEAAQPKQQLSLEALHGAPPIARPSGITRLSGKRRSTWAAKTSTGSTSTEQLHIAPQSTFTDEAETSPREGNSLSDRTARFLRNPIVEGLLVLIVLSNVVITVFETDMRAAQKPKIYALEVLGWLYLLIYVGEFTLRVVAYRTHVFADKWTRLDLAVIVVDVATMLLKFVMSDTFSGFNASIFRLLRSFRLVRVFKVFRFVKELQLLIGGFSGAMKAVCWATGMLEIMVSIWSLIYVEVLYPRVVDLLEAGKFEQCYRCDLAYSSFWNAHMTIWSEVIAGDSWGKISTDVMAAFPLTAFIYIGCLMTTQFAMLNLIFTVIVDAAIRTREEDLQQILAEKECAFQAMRSKLINLCGIMDADNSGELTLEELIEGYENNKEFADTMTGLDISEDDISTLFMIMDEDRSGAVSYMEFVNNIYKMKEQDVHTMLMFVKGYVVDMRFKMKEDVTSLLKENLRQAEENLIHSQQVMAKIEDVLSGSRGSAGDQQHLEAIVQHVEDLVAHTQNASGRRHMQEMVKHVEDLVAGTQNASGRRHMEAMVKHVEDLVAGTQSASSQQHIEEMLKHVEHRISGAQSSSSQQQVEEMVKRVEDLVASTQSTSSQQHMEAMVKHVEKLVACNQSAGGQQNTKEREGTAPSSSQTKELSYILEAQADILRALHKPKRAPQTPKTPKTPKIQPNLLPDTLPLHLVAQRAAAPHLVAQPKTSAPFLVTPKSPFQRKL